MTIRPAVHELTARTQNLWRLLQSEYNQPENYGGVKAKNILSKTNADTGIS